MPWEYTDEYYREYTRNTWNESAQWWGRLADRLAPFGRALLEKADPAPGDTALDMGTGLGEPALTIARLVGPTGSVTGIDLAEDMIRRAESEAERQKVTNARFRVMDCCQLDFPDRSFELVVSRFGFQIFTDPHRAIREAHRVLADDGRIALSVWGLGPQVPFLDVMVGPMLKHAEPDANGYLPTPYELGGPGELVAFLEAAGFHGAEESRVRHTVPFRDADDYLECVRRGTPLGHSLSEESPAVQVEVLEETRANLQKWTTPRGIELPGECVLVTARR